MMWYHPQAMGACCSACAAGKPTCGGGMSGLEVVAKHPLALAVALALAGYLLATRKKR